MRRKTITFGLITLLCGGAGSAYAQSWMGADQGKFLLTGGFSDAEGAGGGGLVPWALITGYGSSDSWGANVHYTSAPLRDVQLNAYGFAVGVFDRFEFSLTHHDLEVTGTALDGLNVTQDIYGLKVRLYGDAVYSQDSWMPQLAIGAQYKRHGGIDDGGSVGLAGLVSPKQLGAKDDNGTDFYLAATKIFLDQSLLVNLTARYTKANQFGLLGFGGDREDGHSLELEGTVGLVLLRTLAVGAEYRGRPNNLGVDDESAAWDIFAAWTPTKNISLVAAYLNLGSILAPVTGRNDDQDGPYMSFQVGF
jgi:hypothetical protein